VWDELAAWDGLAIRPTTCTPSYSTRNPRSATRSSSPWAPMARPDYHPVNESPTPTTPLKKELTPTTLRRELTPTTCQKEPTPTTWTKKEAFFGRAG
jgi:hypothetical protein